MQMTGAGITAFRGSRSTQPARQLILWRCGGKVGQDLTYRAGEDVQSERLTPELMVRASTTGLDMSRPGGAR